MDIPKSLFQTNNYYRVLYRTSPHFAVRCKLPTSSLSGKLLLLRLFMISYAKIWTTIFNDSWFLSLNCQQRGLWLQLIVLAKMQGDTGHVLFKSRSSLAQQLFIDRAVLVRSLSKYQQDGRLYINSKENNVIEVIIRKYSYWQGLKNDKEWRENQQSTDDISTTNNNNNKNTNKNNNIYSQDIPFENIINHLNSVTNKSYRYKSKKTKDKIQARWNEGFRFDDFKYVHAVKAEEWLMTDMEKFLRPETLYGNKFESYRNQEPMKNQMSEQQRKNEISSHSWINKGKNNEIIGQAQVQQDVDKTE